MENGKRMHLPKWKSNVSTCACLHRKRGEQGNGKEADGSPAQMFFVLRHSSFFFVDHFPLCCSSLFLSVGVEGGREGPYPGDREKSERLLFNTGSGARA